MIYSGIAYTLEFVKYYMIYRGGFRAKFSESILYKFFVFVFSLILAELLDFANCFDPLVIEITCLIAMLLVIRENKINIVLMFPFAFLFIGSVDVLMGYFLSNIINMPYKDFYYNKLLDVAVGIMSVLFYAVTYCFLGKNNNSKMLRLNIPKYLITLLGSMSLFVMVAISQGIMLGESAAEDRIPIMAFCFSASVILFYVLILWQVSIERKANNYRLENERYQSYLEKQEEHIKDIIYSDQCMRRFRHDMRAHITALEAESEKGDIEAIKYYLNRMKEEHKNALVEKYTGIVAVDAIIGEWHQAALENNISWKWKGELLPQNTVDIFDLCVIFSNLLSNAVEAASKAEGERVINISCGGHKSNVVINVSNTYDGDFSPASGTTKKDAENHGFGIMNIKEIVDKKNGYYGRNIIEGKYEVEIII